MLMFTKLLIFFSGLWMPGLSSPEKVIIWNILPKAFIFFVFSVSLVGLVQIFRTNILAQNDYSGTDLACEQFLSIVTMQCVKFMTKTMQCS